MLKSQLTISVFNWCIEIDALYQFPFNMSFLKNEIESFEGIELMPQCWYWSMHNHKVGALWVLRISSFQNQVNMKGLDGLQGPVYVGTGCVFNRQALYGYGPSSMPSLPKSSSSSCSWCGCCSCCCPSKKTPKDPSDIYRDAKREELDAAIFNLREIDSKSSYWGHWI